MVGETVLVSADIANPTSIDQPMIYIVQVKDSELRVVCLSFVSGTVPADKSFSFGIAWTPQKAETYTVQVFVWKSWTEPIPLAEPTTMEVTAT